MQQLTVSGTTRKSLSPHRLTSTALVSLAVSSIIVLAGCNQPGGGSAGGSSGDGSVSLVGAGSTFVSPAMKEWIYQYQQDNKGVTINYQAVGSGAGIAQYKAGTVDFGATDAPLKDDELAAMPQKTAIFPIVEGSVAISYNLPGVPSGLKLSSDVLADIYLGKITKWNDPRIVADNPGVNLPATGITVASRSDASGTTWIFTTYLSAVSPDWKTKVGADKAAHFPVGVSGKGSEGVAGMIHATPGSIGYVELAYAVQTKMDTASIKNKAGEFQGPTGDGASAAAAAAAADLQKDLRTPIVDEPGKGVYPICGFTYALISLQPKDSTKSDALVKFIKWSITDGQKMAAKLQYAPLPTAIVDLDNKQLAEIKKS